jgi:ABC-2 type transport system permease protein
MRSIRLILVLAGRRLLALSRMRAILLVIFVPGIVMYAFFTKIFEGPAGAGRPFRAAVIDEDDSPASRRLIDALGRSRVVVVRTENEEEGGPPLTEQKAREQIRRKGLYRVAVIIPRGFGQAPHVLAGPGHAGVRLIFDETQPMEADAIAGMLQMAAGRQLMESSFKPLAGLLPGNPQGSAASDMLVKVKREGVAISRMSIASKHTFLAGIVPMFLLFSASGAARGLLEELESGEIRRLLAAPIHPAHLLLSSILSTLVMSLMQCYSMFLFAWLVFGVEIWTLPLVLAAVTLCTSLACTSFGVLLGSLCRTSQHLDSIGTVVILAMSAAGGSMVPRFVMSPFMQKLGLFTINGWAYDAFLSWVRREGFAGIRLECLVLLLVAAASATAGSLILARRLRAGPSA